MKQLNGGQELRDKTRKSMKRAEETNFSYGRDSGGPRKPFPLLVKAKRLTERRKGKMKEKRKKKEMVGEI